MLHDNQSKKSTDMIANPATLNHILLGAFHNEYPSILVALLCTLSSISISLRHHMASILVYNILNEA